MSDIYFEREIRCGDLEGQTTAPYINASTVIDLNQRYYLEGLVPNAGGVLLTTTSRERLTLRNIWGSIGKFPMDYAIESTPHVMVTLLDSGEQVVTRRSDAERLVAMDFTDVSTELARRLEVFFNRLRGQWQRVFLIDYNGQEFECRWTGTFRRARVNPERWEIGLELAVRVASFETIVIS